MQLRPELEIATMIRAMKDVVIPAVDPENRLAVEQAQLVLGMLALLAHQLPVQFRFDRDELARLAAAAERLERITADEPALGERAERLASLAATARERLARSSVDPSELTGASRDLRAEIGALVTDASDGAGAPLVAAIEREVLELSREQLLRDRALLAPQGFEPGLPEVATLLATPTLEPRTEPNRR